MLLVGLSSGACGHNHEKHDDHDHDHGDKKEVEEGKHNDDEIVFTKTQSANILDFKVEEVKLQPFHSIIKTSGQILSAPGDETLVSATMSGIVKISNSNIVEGYAVKAGQALFSISSQNLTENNMATRAVEAKSAYENAKSEYERTQQLVQDKIVSQQEFERTKFVYEQAKVNYQTLSAGMSGSGKSISSSMSGFLKNLLVQSGQYVEIGTPLATVTQNRRLILRADVSQKYLTEIKGVQTASFTTPYDGQNYSLADMNGRLLSFGRSSENSFYTPVNFEFDNRGNILEGSFVEVYLKSQLIPSTIVLPKSALIEEQGNYFVFIQLDEEGYQKREVKLGASDGANTQILAGIEKGQRVVVKGAYAVKLASLSSSMPEHTH